MHQPETKEKIRESAVKQHAASPKFKRDLLSFAKEYASAKGGECLSDEALLYESKIKLRCSCGNIWETQVKTIIYSKTWCPKRCLSDDADFIIKKCSGCSVEFKDKATINNKNFCSSKCYKKHWALENSSNLKEKASLHHQLNKDKNIKRINNWKSSNKDKVRAYSKKYKSKNKLTVKERIKHSLRTRINDILRGRIKTGSAVQNLGCSLDELIKHLESGFKQGMSWDNWGRDGWHIDHIRPLSSFDLEDPLEFKKACHYSNLQPLWAEENLSKSDKY